MSDCQSGPIGRYFWVPNRTDGGFLKISLWLESLTLKKAECFWKAGSDKTCQQALAGTTPRKDIRCQSSFLAATNSRSRYCHWRPRAQGRSSQRFSSYSSSISCARYKALKKWSRVYSSWRSLAFLKYTKTIDTRYWSKLRKHTSWMLKDLTTGSSRRARKFLTSASTILFHGFSALFGVLYKRFFPARKRLKIICDFRVISCRIYLWFLRIPIFFSRPSRPNERIRQGLNHVQHHRPFRFFPDFYAFKSICRTSRRFIYAQFLASFLLSRGIFRLAETTSSFT